MKSNLQSKVGITVQSEQVAARSEHGEDVVRRDNERKDKTIVVLKCLASEKNLLIACRPEIESMYPSFKTAREVYPKDYKPPKGSKFFQLCFTDPFRAWSGRRVFKLIQIIAEITGLSEDTIDLVELSKGSLFIVLRLPEAAAQTILKKEGELKAKFHTLEKIELTGDLAPLSQSASFAHMRDDDT